MGAKYTMQNTMRYCCDCWRILLHEFGPRVDTRFVSAHHASLGRLNFEKNVPKAAFSPLATERAGIRIVFRFEQICGATKVQNRKCGAKPSLVPNAMATQSDGVHAVEHRETIPLPFCAKPYRKRNMP